MERLSDKAIEIINDLHTERLDYTSEYIPLIEAAQKLSAYEDTGLTPEEIKEFLEDVEMRYVLWIEKRWGISVCRHNDIMNAEKDGRLVVLPPNAPITLDELREMDGEAVFLKRPGYCDRWALVMVHPEVNTPFFLFHLGGVVLAKLELEQGAKAYRRRPEEGDK